MEGTVITNEQEEFWISIENQYISNNSKFELGLGIKAWQKMLSSISTEDIGSFLECGSNIGRNIEILNQLFPTSSKNIIEISSKAYEIVTKKYDITNSFLGSIKNAKFSCDFDLVFTSGVLIHINPAELEQTTKKMYQLSKKYILIAEYFSRTPEMVEYRGEKNKLFKMDFGKYMLDNFSLKLIDYGFLWGVEYDKAGFDDLNYWLFEK